MCCFTGSVDRVSDTRIFARMTAPGRQLVVYDMSMAAPAAVAMVLPIPVVPGSGHDAVRFIALDHLPELFEQLDTMFESPVSGDLQELSMSAPMFSMIKVHTVGAFEASFVPRLADFPRLDPRFRMPPGTLDTIPAYADWGFAVFQLAARHALSQVHPMAFEFATRERGRLFLPTMHVHDGAVHDVAEFSHTLYVQGIDQRRERRDQHDYQGTSRGWPARLTQVDVSGLFDFHRGIYRRSIHGEHPNADTWATLA